MFPGVVRIYCRATTVQLKTGGGTGRPVETGLPGSRWVRVLVSHAGTMEHRDGDRDPRAGKIASRASEGYGGAHVELAAGEEVDVAVTAKKGRRLREVEIAPRRMGVRHATLRKEWNQGKGEAVMQGESTNWGSHGSISKKSRARLRVQQRPRAGKMLECSVAATPSARRFYAWCG
jgi:hypothetical protein